MWKLICSLLVFGLGVQVGRISIEVRVNAQEKGAGGGEVCAVVNGDVNADGSLDQSDAIVILTRVFLDTEQPISPVCPPPQAIGLPDTGQSACCGFVKNQGWIQVPCGEATCKGQDGNYETGCSGEGRFTDNGDGTVTDHCTGLMWQKDTADVNGDGQSTDQDSTYWCDALTYCDSLSFADHDDWRLPNVRELQSIVDYGRFNPPIDPVFSTVPSVYWSSTTFAGNADFAWIVFFDTGRVYIGLDKVISFHVRAVRNGT